MAGRNVVSSEPNVKVMGLGNHLQVAAVRPFHTAPHTALWGFRILRGVRREKGLKNDNMMAILCSTLFLPKVLKFLVSLRISSKI